MSILKDFYAKDPKPCKGKKFISWKRPPANPNPNPNPKLNPKLSPRVRVRVNSWENDKRWEYQTKWKR